ncbi:hypothetical protein V6N11_048441 [Hibiscus sabdariffa]|uniref:NB-ARC domain-containing protein n=1 Tax=Hibiscus sabdariffa TaxID=183260 RepID=A0ABR2PVS0_9ROSI
MALSAVSSAVTTIGELIAKEAISLWGVQDKVNRLQNELKRMVWGRPRCLRKFTSTAMFELGLITLLGSTFLRNSNKGSLRPAFPIADDARSKILLTSRNKEVASHADGRGYLLELECLKEEDSWELFRKTAISNTNSSGYEAGARMKELGKEMVKHCAGLPLAIVVLGGILTTKCSPKEWQMVQENVKSYLNRAEGIVSSKQEEEDGWETAEDVAQGYLIELAERYMIQVRERDEATSKMETFQMHHLMRDLCLSRAKQQNFVFIVDRSDARSLSAINRKVHRVSVQKCIRVQYIQSPNLRSLLFFKAFLPSSRKLYIPFERRMLEMLNRQGRINIGDDEGELEGGLRYIFNNFKLPRVLNYGEEIYTGNLRCLQTLDLGVDHSVYVPDVIWMMEQLRHLYLPVRCKCKTKLKLGTLENLQTLVNFNTQICYLEDLTNMGKLRVLEINGAFKIEDFNREELDKNQLIIQSVYLQSLSIISDEEIDPMHLDHLLLSCYGSLTRCKLEEDPMPMLGRLPNLRVLEVENNGFIGERMLCFAPGFPHLYTLRLWGLDNLEELKVFDGAMPSLWRLEIENCGNLKSIC